MKKVCLMGALMAALLLLTGCDQGPAPSMKVAVVDSNQVMLESAAGKAGMDYLRGLSGELQEELMAMQQSMGNQTAEDSQLFQERFASSQAKMSEEQNRIIAVLNENYEQVLESYRLENNISVIIGSESAVSFSDAADITQDIIAAMNELDLDLSPAANQTEAPGE